MKRIIVLFISITVSLSLVAISCNGASVEPGTGEEEEEEGDSFITSPPTEATNDFDGVVEIVIEISSSNEVIMSFNAVTAQYSSEIALILTYRNNSSEIVTISPIQPEILVRGLGDELVDTLPAVDGPSEVLPSATFQMVYVWDQQDSSGAQVPAGRYRFYVSSITLIWGTNSDTIMPPTAEVVILEP